MRSPVQIRLSAPSRKGTHQGAFSWFKPVRLTGFEGDENARRRRRLKGVRGSAFRCDAERPCFNRKALRKQSGGLFLAREQMKPFPSHWTAQARWYASEQPQQVISSVFTRVGIWTITNLTEYSFFRHFPWDFFGICFLHVYSFHIAFPSALRILSVHVELQALLFILLPSQIETSRRSSGFPEHRGHSGRDDDC